MKIIIGVLVALGIFLSGCAKKKEDIVITIPLVTWGGYAALFAANNGTEPTEDSLFYKYGKFKVKLVQEENVGNHLPGLASGNYNMIWSTMDMLPLQYNSLSKDTRTIPHVIGAFDFSSGGDGIIVRGNIKSPKDMKGKKISVAQYTPSHYFILWYLNTEGLTQNDVKMVFTADAIAAKDAFVNDSSISVCVTWSPFVYDITDPKKPSYVKGSTLLTTTAKGNPSHGIIADVYLVREDFVKEHPEVLEAFTKAMLEGYDIFMKDQQKVAGQIAAFFGIKGGAEEVMLMFGDVVIAGREENKQFFDKTAAFSAYSIFNLSTELYKKNGSELPQDFNVSPDSVVSPEFMLKNLSK